METSSVGAQVGQHAAASVTVATKSGTNALHGDAFEYVRNYLFNGRTATSKVRDSLKQNQFGGVIGGAIIKNKLVLLPRRGVHDQALQPCRQHRLFDDAGDVERRFFGHRVHPVPAPSRSRSPRLS